MKRKRKIHLGLFYYIIFILGVVTVLTGCGAEESERNSALNHLGIEEVKSNTLAVIINNPTEDDLKKISNLKRIEYDKTKSSLLIIPVDHEMTIEIKTLVFEQDNLKEKDVLFKDSVVDDYGVWLEAIRPEGIPSLKICVQRQDDTGEYILSYDGKDGTPEIEYINLKED